MIIATPKHCTQAEHDAMREPAVWATLPLCLNGVEIIEIDAGEDPIAEPAYLLAHRNCPHCMSTLAKVVPYPALAK